MYKNIYKNKHGISLMVFPSHPYDVEAIDMWEGVKKCYQRLFIQYGNQFGEMNTWDCYIEFCQECDKHDKCFRHSDWFTDLVEG